MVRYCSENMFDLLLGIKVFIVGVLVSASTIISPTPFHIKNSQPINSVAASPVASKSAAVEGKPIILLPLNNKNNFSIQGTYSYFGQTIEYLFLVPKKGGDFSGTIDGVCTAKVDGNYEGGNGGKITGIVAGTCSFFGTKYPISTSFKGHLYPETKNLEFELDNSSIKDPIKLNYN